MKNFLILSASFLFVVTVLSSCRSHERCAAYGKVNKIDTQKVVADKTEKSI